MSELPDYLNDLNAMNEAVEQACGKRGFPFQQEYIRELRAIVSRLRRDLNEMQTDYWMTEATTDQRSEAFLRTLNKWDDSK